MWLVPRYKSLYPRAVRRKANLEVTGDEKPKTRLRRRKASFTCLRRKKASLCRPRTKNYNKRHFARKNTNKKHHRDDPWYQLHLNLCGWVLWNDTTPVS